MNLAELDEPNSYHGAVQISACVGWKSRSHHRPMLILALNYLEVAQILTGPHREAPRGSSTCSCHSAGLLQLCIACRFTSSVLPEIVLLPKCHFRPSSSPAAVPGPSHIQNHTAARFPATEPRVLQCQVSTTTRQSWMILKCACHLTSSHCWHSERHPRPPPPSRPEEAVEFFCQCGSVGSVAHCTFWEALFTSGGFAAENCAQLWVPSRDLEFGEFFDSPLLRWGFPKGCVVVHNR